MGVPVPVICCLIAGVVIALIFCGAFFVELFFPKKEESSARVEKAVEPTSDFDIDAMLSKLEEKTTEEKQEVVQPVIAKAVMEEKAIQEEKLAKEEVEDDVDIDALFKQLEEEVRLAEEQELKAQEEAVVEVKEEPKKEVEVEVIKPIVVGPEFDYNVRLQTINESLAKIEKDLAKASRAVNKYEKTVARKEKNEKLLDRKSAELTNLNLVLYSVNNIEDIDPEKKKKQESLVEHITELKASIKSADEYLTQNTEKYDNNKKIKDFLTGEKARYEEEIEELNQLIKAKKN